MQRRASTAALEKVNHSVINKMQREAAIACIIGALALLLLFAARKTLGFSDWYSKYIYPVYVGTVGRILGILPFSVAEILLYILLITCVVCFAGLLIGTFRRKTVGMDWLRQGVHLFFIASALFFLYAAGCGVNYYKQGFAENIGLEVEPYTAEDLFKLCEMLSEDVNEWSGEITRGKMLLNVEERAVDAMEKLGGDYQELSGVYPQPKPLLNPSLLSVQNLTGVYSPFTAEANYNNAITDYNIPFTVCHELSHLRGVMQEDEANFIAYLACVKSEDAAFRYSGSLLAWIYCTNVLRKADASGYEKIRNMLLPEVVEDLKENNQFWARYDGKIAEVSGKVNDTYLKGNGQDDGVQSYDRMVDLVMAYYRQNKGLLFTG